MDALFQVADDVPDGPYADNHRRRKERNAAHLQDFQSGRLRMPRRQDSSAACKLRHPRLGRKVHPHGVCYERLQNKLITMSPGNSSTRSCPVDNLSGDNAKGAASTLARHCGCCLRSSA